MNYYILIIKPDHDIDPKNEGGSIVVIQAIFLSIDRDKCKYSILRKQVQN
jgi:hypothetical protein